MTVVSFLLPNEVVDGKVMPRPMTETTILTQPNTTLCDVEINSNDDVRVYGETNSNLEDIKTEPHKIVCVTTGQTIDTSGYSMKRLGHVKRHNDFVFHIYEVLN